MSRAIVWQDRRTTPDCERLRADGHDAMIRERTGLEIDSYFSATKVAWILDNVVGARQRAEAGQLAFGTVDTWLLWKLTGGSAHITDASNASRTMLFNIHTGRWDDDLLKLFRIPASILPEVRASSEVYGETAANLPAPSGIPIGGIAGDQQAALIGQRCFASGQCKTTYGTGCFTLLNTGPRPVASSNRLLTTIACRIGDRTIYALEGSVFMGGAIVQWLRDGLGIIRSSDEISGLAGSVEDCGGVYMVPAFTGLGAPHWDSRARGLIIGMTRGTTKAHIARAAEEAIAHQVADVIDVMRADVGGGGGLEMSEMRIDGGAAKDDVLMQIQADLLGVELVRPAVIETTALGAAYLAGLAVGVWKSASDVGAHERIDRRFEPQLPRERAQELRRQWRRALERAKKWVEAEAP